MTDKKKKQIREVALQFQRDFKYHLNEVLSLTELDRALLVGNIDTAERLIKRFLVAYSDKVKLQSNYRC